METENSNGNQPNSSEHKPKSKCPTCSCFSGFRGGPIILGVILIVIIITIFRGRLNSDEETGYGPLSAAPIAWNTDYQSALKQATEQNKPILLAFHASWCHFCEKMKKTTYHDAEVVKTVSDFIPVMIDSDSQQSLANQFNVQGIPAYVVVGPDGSEKGNFAGFYDPKEFITKLKDYLP